MKKIKLLTLALLATGLAAGAQAPSIPFAKGKTYTVEQKLSTNATTTVMGNDTKSEMDLITTFNVTVADVKDGNAQLNNMITSMKIEMEQMNQKIKYDSEDSADKDNPMAVMINDVLNKPFKVTVGSNGKLLEVDSFTLDDPQFSSMEAGGYGTEAVFQPLPAKIKAGDKWVDSLNLQNDSRIINYEVESVNGNIVNLKFTGTQKTSKKVEAQGMTFDTNTNGTFEGKSVVDKTNGVIQSSEIKSNLTGTVSGMGMEFPLVSKIKIETKLK